MPECYELNENACTHPLYGEGCEWILDDSIDCGNMNTEPSCNNNNCNWVEDIETGNCGNLYGDDCELNPECNWNCDFVDDYMGWCTYSCDGGPYEIDNSYCEEIIMPECSEMSETECSSDDVCEWIEDIEIGNCSVFDNSESSCTSYSGECYWDEDITYGSCNGYDNSQWACNNAQGCYWDCYYGYCGCNGQEITGVDTECIGQYEINNNYCDELSYILGDVTGDGYLNVMDVVMIVDLILNDEFDMYSDMNQDGILNIMDVIALVNMILEM